MKLDSKNFGPYHSSTITTANNLICNLLETDGCHGEYYDAIRIGIDTYNLMMTKGLRYPIILNLLFGVAAIYQKLALLQSTKNASAYRKDAIKWLEKADGLAALMELSETIQGLRIKRDLANLYLYIGDSKYAKITNMAEVKENARKVINLLAPVYESSRIYMGKTGSDIADDIFVLLDRAYNRLFNILCDEKEYFEAYNILNAMYIIWRKEKGASDPETVRIATSLLNFKFRP